MKKNILAVVFFTLLLPFSLQAQSGFITVKGKEVIGADGKPFIMRGTNLGNWLVPEGYMFKFDKVNSPRLINQAINELIDPDEAKKFWGKYMHSYIAGGGGRGRGAGGGGAGRGPGGGRRGAGE